MKNLCYRWAWLGMTLLFQSRAEAAALSCLADNPSPMAIDQWRRDAAQEWNEGRLSDKNLADLIQSCFGSQPPSCLQRMGNYASRNDFASPSWDGTFAKTPQKQPPDQLFIRGASPFEYQIPEDIEARAAALGWPAVRYKSRHSGGFDPSTASLLMIYVPGSLSNPAVSYDRWLNFALPADPVADAQTPTPQMPIPSLEDYAAEQPGENDLPRVFTMVSLDRRQGSKPAQIYFQRFRRNNNGSYKFVAEINSDPMKCIGCHPNGLRAISPLGYHVRKGESSLNDTDWQAVKLINDSMIQAAGGRSVSWREVPVNAAGTERKALLNPSAFGPMIGPIKPLRPGSRTAEFIAQCAQRRRTIEVKDIFGRDPGRNNVYRMSSTPRLNADKIIRFMACGSCHGGAARAPLNELTEWAQIDFKILVDQSMPLGAHRNPQEAAEGEVLDELTADERMALANCLQAEFAREQKEIVPWLTQEQCR